MAVQKNPPSVTFDFVTENENVIDVAKAFDGARAIINVHSVLNQVDDDTEEKTTYPALQESECIVYWSSTNFKKRSENEIFERIVMIAEKTRNIKDVPIIIIITSSDQEKIMKRFKNFASRNLITNVDENTDISNSIIMCIFDEMNKDNIIGTMNRHFFRSRTFIEKIIENNEKLIKTNFKKEITMKLMKKVINVYPKRSFVHETIERLVCSSFQFATGSTEEIEEFMDYFISVEGGVSFTASLLLGSITQKNSIRNEYFVKAVKFLMKQNYFSEINTEIKNTFAATAVLSINKISDGNVQKLIKYFVNEKKINKIFRKLMCLVGFSKKALLQMHVNKKIKYEEFEINYPGFTAAFNTYLFCQNTKMQDVFIEIMKKRKEDHYLSALDDIQEDRDIHINFDECDSECEDILSEDDYEDDKDDTVPEFIAEKDTSSSDSSDSSSETESSDDSSSDSSDNSDSEDEKHVKKRVKNVMRVVSDTDSEEEKPKAKGNRVTKDKEFDFYCELVEVSKKYDIPLKSKGIVLTLPKYFFEARSMQNIKPKPKLFNKYKIVTDFDVFMLIHRHYTGDLRDWSSRDISEAWHAFNTKDKKSWNVYCNINDIENTNTFDIVRSKEWSDDYPSLLKIFDQSMKNAKVSSSKYDRIKEYVFDCCEDKEFATKLECEKYIVKLIVDYMNEN